MDAAIEVVDLDMDDSVFNEREFEGDLNACSREGWGKNLE